MTDKDHETDGPSRAEHLAWCKQRALEYIDAGYPLQAYTSIASDLSRHPETQDHMGIEMGMTLTLAGHLSTAEDMRTFIEGFN